MFHVKQKSGQGLLFTDQVHNCLVNNKKLTGLTIESLVLLLKEHLAFIGTGFFVQLNKEERSFGVYGSCLEHCDESFLYFPETKGKGFVPGFETENIRFQKEAILKLSSNVPYCCIGSERSLSEKSVKREIDRKTAIFSVGDYFDVGVVSELLFDVGYKKSEIASDPGTYSLRGDVLDVFPYHFKNPFRVSFEFDKVESISLYNPNTQISIKPIKTLRLDDFKKELESVDNIGLIEHSGFDDLYTVSHSDGLYSISKKGGDGSFDLGFRVVSLFGKTRTEKAKEVKLFSDTIDKRVFVGNQKKEGVGVFEDDFFSCSILGSISRCVVSDSLSALFVSGSEINSKKRVSDRWAPIKESKNGVLNKNSISNVNHGEFVVHRDFGIGVYLGVKEKNGKEVVLVEYQDGALVSVSLDQINLVHKYVGSGNAPKISSLGSKKWGAEVARAKKAAEDVALDVLRGYSNKNILRPFKYVKENDLDNVLSQSFAFIETPDQKKAINKVFSDMNKPKPMDRLVCGDVGFGKTEIAIRAIFKAFLSDKLSVFLCPTTILADQHYMTCHERLAPLGLSVGLLSRFKTRSEQTQIIKDLFNKKIDVLVGTHRILSKDIVLTNLGLLIVDEEHRFGVKDKELIRKIREGVDVLTLTATPIPRTLQQSLVGLKDVSVMLTSPEARKPIITSVKYFDWSLVFSRIEFELSRSGQVYFLNNDISTIPSAVDRLKKQFPKNKIAGASGKMSSKELEGVVLAFFSGDVDVLVCTTIIESGLDVTNANSIIIRDAQNLGLAQLYQIRGRVGRGYKQGYCHLLIPKKPLEKSAFKRLRSLERNTALGSGYNISMEDLEIRGAGSIFGHKQSGHITTVGFQMYCDLLSIEIQKTRTGNRSNLMAPQVTTDFQSDISGNYIENMSLRIDYYYRIGSATSVDQLDKVKEELVDAFGPIPKKTKNLLLVALLKLKYKQTPVSQIDIQDNILKIVIQPFKEEKQLDFLSRVGAYNHKNLKDIRFKEVSGGLLGIFLNISNPGDIFNLLFDFVRLFSPINTD